MRRQFLFRKFSVQSVAAIAAAVVARFALLLPASASGYTFGTLHSFFNTANCNSCRKC
jgi:hypothetical protein